MAKKEKQAQYQSLSHDQEYSIIRKDLYKVLALNAVYLVALLALYFTNRNTHYLDNFFSKLLHF